jgi:hypothetical protein
MEAMTIDKDLELSRRLRRLEDMILALAKVVSRMEGSHDHKNDDQWFTLEEAHAQILNERAGHG